MRTLILSDLHLGNRHSNVALVNEVLDREPFDRLILNGDTINSDMLHDVPISSSAMRRGGGELKGIEPLMRIEDTGLQ